MSGSGSNLVAPQHAPRPLDARFALVETHNQFRLLVNGVVDYAIYMLDPNGLIMTWNLGAERPHYAYA